MPPTIDADDPIVEDLLAGMLELVSQAGGWVHPDASIVARSGHLHLECAGSEGLPLLRIPAATFVRVDAVVWDVSDGQLVITDILEDLGEIELPMLYLQTALHNQAGRPPWLAANHPAVDARLSAGVVTAVQHIEPGFRAEPIALPDLLFANRCFRLALSGASTPERVLVPIVDLLNHDTRGASGHWDGEDFTVALATPEPPECSLDYGMQRDAIEMAVIYGFADASTTVLHSAPMVLDLPEVGVISIGRHQRDTSGAMQPRTVSVDGQRLRFNRMTFTESGCEPGPNDISAATGLPLTVAEAIVRAAINENHRLLGRVREAARANAGSQAAQMLACAAEFAEQSLVRTTLRTVSGNPG